MHQNIWSACEYWDMICWAIQESAGPTCDCHFDSVRHEISFCLLAGRTLAGAVYSFCLLLQNRQESCLMQLSCFACS